MRLRAKHRDAGNPGVGGFAARFGPACAVALLAGSAGLAQDPSASGASGVALPPAAGTGETGDPTVGRSIGNAFRAIRLPRMSTDGFAASGDAVPIDRQLYGAEIEISEAWRLRDRGAGQLYLEWTGSLSVLQGAQSSSRAAPDPLVLSNGAPPVGSISLSASHDMSGAQASASVQVEDSAGDTATITTSAFSPSGSGATTTQFAASSTDTGGAFTALSTDGDAGTATAYGAIYDDGGIAVLGYGDLAGTRVNSTITNRLVMVEQELLVARPVSLQSGWTFTPKVGPMYRFLKQDISRTDIVDLDESNAGGDPLPALGLAATDEISTHYAGLVGGLALSRPISDAWSAGFSLEGGLALFQGRYEGRTTVISPAPTTVSSDLPVQKVEGLTPQIGASVNFTKRLRRNGRLSVGLFADYLGDVPALTTTTTGTPDTTVSGGEASFTGSGQGYRTTRLGTGEAWNYGIKLSYVILF